VKSGHFNCLIEVAMAFWEGILLPKELDVYPLKRVVAVRKALEWWG